MATAISSPKITNLSWGQIEVEGIEAKFKDVKIFPGGAREWDWNETGTRHEPGVQPADVQELLDKGVKVIVLGNGVYERLRVCPDTLHLLESKKIDVNVMQTEKAVSLYNQLCEKQLVGGLFHSTC